MKTILAIFKAYLILSGLFINATLILVVLLKPGFAYKAYEHGINILAAKAPGVLSVFQTPAKTYNLNEEIAQNFEPWKPLVHDSKPAKGIYIGTRSFSSLTRASASLRDGETLHIGPGTYSEPLIIKANHVSIIGRGHVIIERTSAEGKAAIVIKGSHTLVENLECRHIAVRDRNGACIRLEGKNLRINHVYFHNSQQGLLTGSQPGLVEIDDSRFERLGLGGRAHGVYVGGGQLTLTNSLFIAAQDQGHEIKSRAARTFISKCVIASLSSNDSRLIDVTGGGRLTITDSILQQGPRSTNQDMIGYGLERNLYTSNQAKLTNNIIIMEREGPDVLFHANKELPPLIASGNVIISENDIQLSGANLIFETRKEVGLAPYPSLPSLPSN